MITVKADNVTLFLQEETIVAITEPEATLERVMSEDGSYVVHIMHIDTLDETYIVDGSERFLKKLKEILTNKIIAFWNK